MNVVQLMRSQKAGTIGGARLQQCIVDRLLYNRIGATIKRALQVCDVNKILHFSRPLFSRYCRTCGRLMKFSLPAARK